MKNIGSVNALYPTPVTVVGTVIDGKVNWINIAHIGIIGMNKIMLSMGKSHYSNQGIIKNKTASVHLVSADMLVPADYVGIVSGAKVDKSTVFEYKMGQLAGVPIIKNAPVAMECELVDIYQDESHDCFILKIVHTHVDERYLDKNDKINYDSLRPVLFEMGTRSYLSTGRKIADCWQVGNEYNKK